MPYGTVQLDTLQSSAVGTPVTFTDANGVQAGTLCRAWVNINGNSGASPTIRASFNVSSVTRNSTGNYTINFTTALTDANYCVNCGVNAPSTTYTSATALVSAASQAGASIGTTTTQLTIITGNASSAALGDYGYLFVSVFR